MACTAHTIMSILEYSVRFNIQNNNFYSETQPSNKKFYFNNDKKKTTTTNNEVKNSLLKIEK